MQLQDESPRLRYAIENKFPYPIARAFYQLQNIDDWKAEIPQLANILGLVLQHIATIAIADYLSGNVRDEKINDMLIRAFRNPVTHGVWAKILQNVLKCLRQQSHEMFMPELSEHPTLNAMNKKLVDMRNYLLKSIPEFLPVPGEHREFKQKLVEFLRSLAFLKDYALISVKRTQTEGGVKIHTCYLHVGFQDNFQQVRLQSDLDLDAMRVALLNLRTHELLYLYPFYALHESESDSFPLLLLRFMMFNPEKTSIKYVVTKETHTIGDTAEKIKECQQEGADFKALLQGPIFRLKLRAKYLALDVVDEWQALSAGQQIDDKYEIIEHLRRGGMADVYKVRDIREGHVRALKLLPFQLLGNYTLVQRFRQEAMHAMRLDHRNITRIIDYGEALADHYLVMELATGWKMDEGQTALDAGDLSKPVDEQTVITIAKQTCAALDYIHNQGIVHRDIKPGNLLLFEDEQVKVTDFGIARSREAMKLTLTGLAIGTPEYMAPEQAEGGKEITPAADIYALGAVMYELLTGQPPFKRNTPLATVYAHVHDPVPSLKRLNPHVSNTLQRIVKRCLEKEPQKRFRSIRELYEALS